jgi:hypothetical protein
MSSTARIQVVGRRIIVIKLADETWVNFGLAVHNVMESGKARFRVLVCSGLSHSGVIEMRYE